MLNNLVIQKIILGETRGEKKLTIYVIIAGNKNFSNIFKLSSKDF